MTTQINQLEKSYKEEGLRIISKDSFSVSQTEQDEIRWYIGLEYLNSGAMCSMEIYNAYVTCRYDLEQIQDEMGEAWDGDWRSFFQERVKGDNNQVFI